MVSGELVVNAGGLLPLQTLSKRIVTLVIIRFTQGNHHHQAAIKRWLADSGFFSGLERLYR